MAITSDDLGAIKDFQDIALLFEAKLNWPIGHWNTFEGIPQLYGISPNEIEGVESLEAVKPLERDQNWGLFLVDFGPNKLKPLDLRAILFKVATRARPAHSNPTWLHNNLIFVCKSNGGARFTLCHFRGDKLANAKLKHFGWEDPSEARTTIERCLPALAWGNRQNWDNAWDAEQLTDEFFKDYKATFEQVEAKVVGLKGERQRRFTQGLMNRLMFLCFLQKKGWLEFPAGDTRSRKQYIFNLYRDFSPAKDEKCFYDRLKKLFFSGLNSPNGRGGERKALEPLIGRVPFLNGGLFDRNNELDADSILIPDEAFEPLLGQNGLFNRYTFTATESTPLTIEVALDPEMLGKIFEELVVGRHKTGSYYTPRSVVSFMCRQAIKGYLGGHSKLVDDHSPDGIGIPEARELVSAIESIKVCDPACGSGAYLLGMLQEIRSIQAVLDTTRKESDDPEERRKASRDDYNRKLTIIENCLYGVDIDPFAVNIAWLRLWLALVIDQEDNPLDNPALDVSLPNLDAKIEVGDSLLSPDPSVNPALAKTREQKKYSKGHSTGLQYVIDAEDIDEAIDRFTNLRGQYQRAHGEPKRSLKTLMDRALDKVRELITGSTSKKGDTHDWRVEFCDVFKTNGGFDVIVANPPYISALEFKRKYTAEYRAALNALYRGVRPLPSIL